VNFPGIWFFSLRRGFKTVKNSENQKDPMSWQGFQFSKRVMRLVDSPVHASSAHARKMSEIGPQVIDFVVGSPEFRLPKELERKTDAAMKSAKMEFGAVEGEPGLIRAIIDKFARENGIKATSDEIIVCNGGKEVLSEAVEVLVNEGDEVVLFAPFWPSYRQFIYREGGKPLIIAPQGPDFKITPAQLENAIGPRTKWVILNNPQNPCGIVYSKTELEGFAEIIRKHPHVAVIADECFELFNYSTTKLVSFATLPGMRERTFTANGIGKSYGKPGIRIGYGCGPRELIARMRTLQSAGPTHANTPGQAAAEVMLGEVGQQHVAEMTGRLKEHRDFLYHNLNAIPGFKMHLPESCYFAFPSVKETYGDYGNIHIHSSADLVKYLAGEGIMLLDGAECGMPGHVRMAFTADLKQLKTGLGNIYAAIGRLLEKEKEPAAAPLLLEKQ
jgi:aspartate aminotransferase